MRYSPSEPEKTRSKNLRAAVFVDYENLFSFLYNRLGSRGRPDEYINELLDELQRYLQEELLTQTSLISAYADFTEMYGSGQYIQRSLYMRGVEPRFVPATLQRNAAEIQLCVDAVDVLHNRPDIRSYVVLTGDRPYVPLVQQFKRYGCHALIVSLSPPPASEVLPHVEDDVFLDALNLLSDPSRRAIASGGSRSGSGSSGGASTQRQGRPQPVEHKDVTDEGAHRALEIIEEHFGQYEEVYLTPLLRKLSELLDEDLYDPKTLISELEEAGAVWLEKRRGFPYDYTVLLIDTEHPDVQAIQKDLYAAENTLDDAPYEAEDEPYEDDYEGEDYEDEDEDEDYDAEAYSNGSPDDDYDDFEEDYAEEEDEDRL